MGFRLRPGGRRIVLVRTILSHYYYGRTARSEEENQLLPGVQTKSSILILKNIRLGYHFLSIDTENEDRVGGTL